MGCCPFLMTPTKLFHDGIEMNPLGISDVPSNQIFMSQQYSFCVGFLYKIHKRADSVGFPKLNE